MSWPFLLLWVLVAAVILRRAWRGLQRQPDDLWGLIRAHEMQRAGAIIISVGVVPAAMIWTTLREGIGQDWQMEVLVRGLSLVAIPFMYGLEWLGFNILFNNVLVSADGLGKIEPETAESVVRNLKRYRRVQSVLFRWRGRDLNEVLEGIQREGGGGGWGGMRVD